MSLITNAFIWSSAGPRERAMMVRNHANAPRPVPRANLCNLFNLTEDGLTKILNGDDWRPEHEPPSVNYIEG